MKAIEKIGLELFGFRSVAYSRYAIARICTSNVRASGDPGYPQILPQLPVPPLEQTLEKYIKTVRPHLTDEELNTTKKIVKEFETHIGQKLQILLEQRAKTTNNWLADWWLHSAYLDFRWPVVAYSNPGMVYPYQNFRNKREQYAYAANVILAALDYKSVIDSNALPVDKMGKEPLDMGQYKKIFGTCRIPGLTRDTLSFNDSKHVTIIHNGHIFSLPIWGEDGVMLSIDQLVDQLEKIAEASKDPNSYPIGILTSEHRDTWGKAYQELLKDSQNTENLKAIEKSIMVVCLDRAFCNLSNEKWVNQITAACQSIHGGGSSKNSCNRWFDKTVQYIVCESGMTGFTYEHSPAEGQPVAVFSDYVIEYINAKKGAGNPSSKSPLPFKRHDFNITSEIAKYITLAKDNIEKIVEDVDMNCFTFENYGKDFIKSQKMSPDSFIQMAIQLAFYRLHRVPGAHYESAATRKYVEGRTETIRSCSVESIEFAKAMLNPSLPASDKAKYLQNAIKAHKDYSLQAVNGLGVDRHLLGLKLIAAENGIELPKLYSDPGFSRSSTMRISTSQVASKYDAFMAYAPLVPNGYATCYNPRPKDINFATSAFKSNEETSVQEYRKALEDSLMDMHNVLMMATKSKL